MAESSVAAADEKLSAAQRSKIRKLATPHEMDPSEEAGELNIVPFLDIITNVMMFVLASISVSFTATLDSDAPKAGGAGVQAKIESESLNLTVLIGSDGYYVKGRGGSLAPGCDSTGTGITVPLTNATAEESTSGKKYNPGKLQECARVLKNWCEKNEKDEEQVMISANPNVPFQEVVRVMDALRCDDTEHCDGKGKLFPKVVFTVVK
ncbi:MAG: ExbD/TolR family protein [Polyangiales bacterium]